MTIRKPILCMDFDGVIHWYRKGWQDGTIYDDPVPGAFAFLEKATKHFEIHIYSSRSKTDTGIAAMRAWFLRHLPPDDLADNRWYLHLVFSSEKPPAFLTIDDRALQFTGVFPTKPEELLTFRPWNVQG